MDVKQFQSLMVIEDPMKITGLEVGTLFLTGSRMISQKETKNIGQEISWYEVTEVSKDGKNVSITPRYGVLKRIMEER